MAKLFFRSLVWHLLCSNLCVMRLISSAWLISLTVTNTQSKHSIPYTVLLSKGCPCFILQGICSPTPLFVPPFHWLFEFTVIFAGSSNVFYTLKLNCLQISINLFLCDPRVCCYFQFNSAANVINVTFHNYEYNGDNNINIMKTKKKWEDNISAQGFYGEGFPCLGLPTVLSSRLPLQHRLKCRYHTWWQMVKVVCVTPIQLAYYLSFLNMKFHFSTEGNQISCSQCIFLTWRHWANEWIKLWNVPEAKFLIKGKWIAFSAFGLILQDYNCLDEHLFLVSQVMSQQALGQGTV